jgi:serine/threonine protein kinase
MRKRIALGAAEGLHYLHEMCNPRIFHQDLKPDNILLDDEFEAVVADFGLIKLLTHEESHPSTLSVRGTRSYIALEYFSSSRATEKGDVYAFSIVLLELICGT